MSLKIFGANFFDSYQTSFAPLNEQNFAADYVLDVGDVLEHSITWQVLMLKIR